MHKPSLVCSAFLTVLIPLAIFLLSSNLILRLPLTYEFYFNDSQSIDEIDYSVTVSQVGKAIGSYFSMPGKDKFQVYEVNGHYKDAVFNAKEQQAMKNAKAFLLKELIAGLLALLLFIIIYANTVRKDLSRYLRIESWIAMGVTVLFTLLQLILVSSKGFRGFLYNAFIGVKLGKSSDLVTILGGHFYSTYLAFDVIATIILLLIFIYFNHKYTKPDRLFYNRRFM